MDTVEQFGSVVQDGIDYDIECGMCGHRERNVATDEAQAWRRLAEHVVVCPENQEERP